MLTQQRLKEILSYNPEMGLFTWLASAGRAKVGDVAGTINGQGYRHIKIDGKKHLGHRLAFLYMNGAFPKEHTDHIDGNPANNRWSNLRECTRAENLQNKASHKNSSSKYPGVCWHKQCKKWKTQIMINGKRKFLGYFETEEAAYQAYCAAKAEIHTFNPVPRS
jgi:hypothetical protein